MNIAQKINLLKQYRNSPNIRRCIFVGGLYAPHASNTIFGGVMVKITAMAPALSLKLKTVQE
jgi:hypothetical protein